MRFYAAQCEYAESWIFGTEQSFVHVHGSFCKLACLCNTSWSLSYFSIELKICSLEDSGIQPVDTHLLLQLSWTLLYPGSPVSSDAVSITDDWSLHSHQIPCRSWPMWCIPSTLIQSLGAAKLEAKKNWIPGRCHKQKCRECHHKAPHNGLEEKLSHLRGCLSYHDLWGRGYLYGEWVHLHNFTKRSCCACGISRICQLCQTDISQFW